MFELILVIKNNMLEQAMVQTSVAKQLKPFFNTAQKPEIKRLDHPIQRIHQSLATYETRHDMNNQDFERKFKSRRK